jgi:hypothetical protein
MLSLFEYVLFLMLDLGQFWVRYKDYYCLLVFVNVCDLSGYDHGSAPLQGLQSAC